MRYHTLFFLVVFLSLYSCSTQNEGSSSIPEETFIEFYSNYLVLQEQATLSGNSPEQTEQVVDSLYREYNVTEAEVQQTLEYYKKDLPRWKQLHEKTTKRLEELHREQINNKAQR